MSEVIVGCDLDSTLVDLSSSINKINIELGYNYKASDLLDWYLQCFPEDYRRRCFELYSDDNFMCSLKPINGAQQKIRLWKSMGYKIVIITARHPELKHGTLKMVKELFPEVDETILVGHNIPKKDYMIAKKIKYWIDDAPHGVLESINLDITSFLISNNETKYNWHVRDTEGLNVVESIKDVNI